jgi:glycosyltransferase involved in cell wall biosynthesis
MKICILGPVNTSKYFGGVAVFTQGLAAAFAAKGYKVQIITHYAEQKRTNGNVPIITVSSSCWRKNPVVPFRIAEKIVEFNPDLIISSLEFGLANRVLRHKGYRGTIIHFLHAFPAFYQRVVHNIFIDKVTKYIAAYSDFVIANSEYTASINELYGLKSDAIMNVCVGDEFFNELKKINKVTKRAGTVIFAGRLVREKQVDKLIRAFSNTKLGVILTIIGDGPEKDALEALKDNLLWLTTLYPEDTVEGLVFANYDSKFTRFVVTIPFNNEEHTLEFAVITK